MNMILDESLRNITKYSVPCTGTAEKPPTTSSTNPQTLTSSHSTCLRKQRCYCSALFQIPLAANKTLAFLERICCYFDELAFQKQTTRRPKEEREWRSEENFLQNTVAEEETVGK